MKAREIVDEKETSAVEKTAMHYLSEELPAGWLDWTEEQLYEWLEENAWEPFELWDGKRVWDMIVTSTPTQPDQFEVMERALRDILTEGNIDKAKEIARKALGES